MVMWSPCLHVDECQHADLRVLLSAHSHHLTSRWLNGIRSPISPEEPQTTKVGVFQQPARQLPTQHGQADKVWLLTNPPGHTDIDRDAVRKFPRPALVATLPACVAL